MYWKSRRGLALPVEKDVYKRQVQVGVDGAVGVVASARSIPLAFFVDVFHQQPSTVAVSYTHLLEGGFLTVKQPYNTTIYNTALDLRLIRDDELQGESGSIQTQRMMLRQYGRLSRPSALPATLIVSGTVLTAPTLSLIHISPARFPEKLHG